MDQKNPIQSAQRIFTIIELLAFEGELGVTEIANRTKLNKSTVHRMLASLSAMDYVIRNRQTDQYALSLKFVALSQALLDRLDVLKIARDSLKHLTQISGETVHLVQRADNNIYYIDKVESQSNSIRMVSHIGVSKPMYCTAVGKAILAEMEDHQVKEIWEQSEITAITPHTITDFSDFMEEIEETRQRKYALDNEENELGVRCIGASVKNHLGLAEFAFSISAPSNRMTDERVQELSTEVLRIRNELSQDLGYWGG